MISPETVPVFPAAVREEWSGWKAPSENSISPISGIVSGTSSVSSKGRVYSLIASRVLSVVAESFESEAAGTKTVVSDGDAAAGRTVVLTGGVSLCWMTVPAAGVSGDASGCGPVLETGITVSCGWLILS